MAKYIAILHLLLVSLFTREWIEISAVPGTPLGSAVSLFTREWIEIRPD